MAKTKRNTLKEQRETAELELIIEEFGRHMRNADRTYVASGYTYCNSAGFTPNMEATWYKYTDFCRKHLQ